MKKSKELKLKNNISYSYGEVFTNPYLGCKFSEVLNVEKKRLGWIWLHRDGRVVVAPHLGTYVWFNEGGVEWTSEEGAKWLVRKYYERKKKP